MESGSNAQININGNSDAYATKTTGKIDLNIYIQGGIPQVEKAKKSKLFYIIFSIGLFYAGYNLALFFDTVFLKLYLCSPTVFACNFTNVHDPNILKANAFYNFIRSINIIFFMIFLLLGGVISDNIRTINGNRLPLILVGSIIASIGYFIAPIIIPINFNLALLAYSIIGAGFGLTIGPELSLISGLFLKNERSWAAVGLAAFGSIGVIIGIVLNEVFINPFIANDNFLSIHWLAIWFIVGFCILLLGILTFYLTPKFNPPFPGNGIIKDIIESPKLIFKVGKNQGSEKFEQSEHDFLLMLLVSIFWGGGGFLLTANFSNFINDLRLFHFISLDPSRIYLLMGIFCAISAVPIAFLITKYGKVHMGILGSILMIIFSSLICLRFLWNDTYFLSLIVINGFGTVIISTVSISLSADLVPRGKEGQMMGIIIIATNILSPISSLIVGIALAEQTDLFLSYITIFIFIALFYAIPIPFLVIMKYDKWVELQYWEFYHRYLRYRGIIKKIPKNQKVPV